MLPPLRFALQLLRGRLRAAGRAGHRRAVPDRDPSYLLLKDLLRAAGLPMHRRVGDGSPIRWPLLTPWQPRPGAGCRPRLRVQGVLAGQLEAEPCRCLADRPARRALPGARMPGPTTELRVEGLGAAWALPSLELLMDEPERKVEVWRAMRRIMPRWKRRRECRYPLPPDDRGGPRSRGADRENAAFSHPWSRNLFADGLKSYDCWLMFDGDEQIGHGIIQIILDEAHLLNITVRPQSQGRGLGLQLLEHPDAARPPARRGRVLPRSGASSQSAYRLYERYGFTKSAAGVTTIRPPVARGCPGDGLYAVRPQAWASACPDGFGAFPHGVIVHEAVPRCWPGPAWRWPACSGPAIRWWRGPSPGRFRRCRWPSGVGP